MILEPSRLHPSWKTALGEELRAPYLTELTAAIDGELARGAEIYPARENVFRALELTPLDEVRVVIIGQDPYHGPGQAHGLSFSVKEGVTIPPSLRNIYKELEADLGIPPAQHGFLEHWARQGVLLLNNVLTVERGNPASHKDRGWERFTDAVVRSVSEAPAPTVFILWGNPARDKAAFAGNGGRHLVLTSPHPSPMSARRGFFGSKPFSKANYFLVASGRQPINWALPPL